MTTLSVEYPTDWKEYELIDCGDGEKLERFGPDGPLGYTIVRPDPRALWVKGKEQSVWEHADATYKRTDPKTGQWIVKRTPSTDWQVHYHDLTFILRPTEFKHVGVFPEQAVNWQWLTQTINKRPLKVLNLFAYTGGATLAAACAGAQVTHVDAVKSAIDWAAENVRASQLEGRPIRWIVEDAYKFVVREGRRGSTYDGIIMDPPRFGRGTKGEVWKLEEDLPKLLVACKSILSATPAFVLMNAYTADISAIVVSQLLSDLTKSTPGVITSGELALKEEGTDRLLPNGIFARWSTK